MERALIDGIKQSVGNRSGPSSEVISNLLHYDGNEHKVVMKRVKFALGEVWL